MSDKPMINDIKRVVIGLMALGMILLFGAVGAGGGMAIGFMLSWASNGLGGDQLVLGISVFGFVAGVFMLFAVAHEA